MEIVFFFPIGIIVTIVLAIALAGLWFWSSLAYIFYGAMCLVSFLLGGLFIVFFIYNIIHRKNILSIILGIMLLLYSISAIPIYRFVYCYSNIYYNGGQGPQTYAYPLIIGFSVLFIAGLLAMFGVSIKQKLISILITIVVCALLVVSLVYPVNMSLEYSAANHIVEEELREYVTTQDTYVFIRANYSENRFPYYRSEMRWFPGASWLPKIPVGRVSKYQQVYATGDTFTEYYRNSDGSENSNEYLKVYFEDNITGYILISDVSEPD
ncbi:MAG: hypothetical protein FWH52_01805 [Synergistaceae bacterium]|nr:hypothetical protein [Synergistaceae bacterium]